MENTPEHTKSPQVASADPFKDPAKESAAFLAVLTYMSKIRDAHELQEFLNAWMEGDWGWLREAYPTLPSEAYWPEEHAKLLGGQRSLPLRLKGPLVKPDNHPGVKLLLEGAEKLLEDKGTRDPQDFEFSARVRLTPGGMEYSNAVARLKDVK